MLLGTKISPNESLAVRSFAGGEWAHAADRPMAGTEKLKEMIMDEVRSETLSIHPGYHFEISDTYS